MTNKEKMDRLARAYNRIKIKPNPAIPKEVPNMICKVK